jgi:hypothetical protein
MRGPLVCGWVGDVGSVMMQAAALEEVANLSWGEFKVRLADAVCIQPPLKRGSCALLRALIIICFPDAPTSCCSSFTIATPFLLIPLKGPLPCPRQGTAAKTGNLWAVGV